MAKFEKGNPGRPKGAKNKKQLDKQKVVEKLFNKNGGFESLFDDINEIEDPYQKVQAKMKVVEFFMPKLKAMDLTANVDIDRKHRTPEEIQIDLDSFNDD